MDSRPFEAVEGEGFMRLMADAYPQYPLPTAKYFAGILPAEHERVKSIMQPKIDCSFTSDVVYDVSRQKLHLTDW